MSSNGRYTLSFDVGGSHVKAALIGHSGDVVSERHKIRTPKPLTPNSLLRVIVTIGETIGHYDRVAVGIPGVVHDNVVYSLPVSGRRAFKGFPLGQAVSEALSAQVKVANDATMQGLGVITGTGVEMVITLGTGLGTALFVDGVLNAHYQTLPGDNDEFGSPFGDAARRKVGTRCWSRRVHDLIVQLRDITNYDRIYVGGGNAKRLKVGIPRYAALVDNIAGVLGGHYLWEWGGVR